MITVYAIKLTDSEYVLVNAKGWDASPKIKAYARVSSGFDRSGFNEEYVKYYSKSWEVDTDDLNIAFDATNGFGGDTKARRMGGATSGSVGNMFVKDGDAYFCDNFGFVAVGYYKMEA